MLEMELPPRFREERDVWAVFKGWFHQAPADTKHVLPNVDLDAYVWLDDMGHSAIHYLIIGRQRTNYARWATRFPLFGPHAFPGGTAAESKEVSPPSMRCCRLWYTLCFLNMH